MKSFKKYLNEDFPVLVGKRGDEEDKNIGYPSPPHLDLLDNAKRLGHVKIGDETFHFHDALEEVKKGSHKDRAGMPPDRVGFITKIVNGKHQVVGHSLFSPDDHSAIGDHFSATSPTLNKEHRKKGLMSELYKRWADASGHVLRSGHYQSHGGRNIWNELSMKGDVRIMNQMEDHDQEFPRYDPQTTPKLVANSQNSSFVYFPVNHPERKQI